MADEQKNPSDKSKEPISPEERLFRVISSGAQDLHLPEDEEGSSQDLLETDFFSKVGMGFRRLAEKFQSRIVGAFKAVGSQIAQAAAKSDPEIAHRAAEIFKIKTINRALMVIVTMLVGYLLFDFIFVRLQHALPSMDAEGPIVASVLPEGLQGRVDLSQYVARTSQRNVFLPPPPPAPPAPPPSEQEAAAPAAPPVNFTLVGISWDETEYVAMIEADPEKGASFVRKGEFLGNGVKVVDITEKTVVLSRETQQWELS